VWAAVGCPGPVHATMPVPAEQCQPGGIGPCCSAHGTYHDGSSHIVTAADGKESASGIKNLQPGPATDLLTALG